MHREHTFTRDLVRARFYAFSEYEGQACACFLLGACIFVLEHLNVP